MIVKKVVIKRFFTLHPNLKKVIDSLWKLCDYRGTFLKTTGCLNERAVVPL
ncbi:MAG: hypothetical protein RBT69_02635 [Spirochaetia bacterium]|nr:hypothetical protein [Spirochaetia bacterium]